MESIMYRIIETCNPYNARSNYNGQKVLEYDGPTPVKWIVESGFSTIEEAKSALMHIAKSGSKYESGYWYYEDEDSVREMAAAIKEDHPGDFENNMEPDMSWFKGPGIYERNGHEPYPVLLEGETSFRDDVESYWIEEL